MSAFLRAARLALALLLVAAATLPAQEAPPKSPAPPAPPDPASRKFVEGVLGEVALPPLRPFGEEPAPALDKLSVSPRVIEQYGKTDEPSRLRSGVRKARAVLWAISPAPKVPPDLAEEVKETRTQQRLDPAALHDSYRAPANENQFKEAVLQEERKVAVLLGLLTESLEELRQAGLDRNKEPRRWQAHYDLTLAHLELEIAFLHEYQSMLGQLRKDPPPRDPAVHGGWKLSAQPRLQGDVEGKKMVKEAHQLLARVLKEHPGTPWEALARRACDTALGLEWKPVP
jgi:hypothetical protein